MKIHFLTSAHNVSAAILVEVSVAATKKVLHQDDLDFAFLDVDVTNGKTFELAQILGRKPPVSTHIPSSAPRGLWHCQNPSAAPISARHDHRQMDIG